jgi:energy-coupling factor transporter ATP-binding protein EcfA2
MNKHVLLIYGLPGSGKTTLAQAVHDLTRNESIWFNADKVRSTLSSDLNFSEASRIEQARRMGCLASLALDGSSLSLAIVDFVNPTLPTYSTFLENLNRPVGNRLDDSGRIPESFLGGTEYPVVSVLMDTIRKDESRFADTAELFQRSGGCRKPDLHITSYLKTEQEFLDLARKVLTYIEVITFIDRVGGPTSDSTVGPEPALG